MSKFCGSCGAPREEGRFCGSCGRPYEDAPAAGQAPTPAAPVPPAPPVPPAAPQAPAQPWQPAAAPQAPQFAGQAPQAPQQWQQPGAPAPQWQQPSAPARPLANPFAGVPIWDYVRDGLALVFLFTTLGVPWDGERYDGADAWWVIVAVLLSVASLAIPYVFASQVVPGMNRQHATLAKIGLNAPMLVAAVVALVTHLVKANDYGNALGSGVAFAVFGAVLALQPRHNDEDPQRGSDALWNKLSALGVVAVGLSLVVYVVRLIVDLIDEGALFDEVIFFLGELVSFPVLWVVVLGVPAFLGLRSAVWQRTFAVVSVSYMVALLVPHMGDEPFILGMQGESWKMPGFGVFLLAAAAALAISRPAQRRLAPVEPVQGWLDTASNGLKLSGAAYALTALATLFIMIHDEVNASSIIVVILLAAAAALGFAAASMLANIRQTRVLVVGLAAGQLILGLVLAILANSQDVGTAGFVLLEDGWGYQVPMYAFSVLMAAAAFGLTGAAIWALVGPKPVRTALGPLFPEQQAAPAQQHAQPQYGQPPVQGQAPQQWAPPAPQHPQAPQPPQAPQGQQYPQQPGQPGGYGGPPAPPAPPA